MYLFSAYYNTSLENSADPILFLKLLEFLLLYCPRKRRNDKLLQSLSFFHPICTTPSPLLVNTYRVINKSAPKPLKPVINVAAASAGDTLRFHIERINI